VTALRRTALVLPLAVLVLGAGAAATPAAAQESFTLELEGRRAEIPTRRLGGLRYVALADLARGFGGAVEWLDVGERVALSVLGERVVFRRNQPFVEARGGLHQIPHAPVFERGELWVPFSFIQQGLPAIFPERFDFSEETARLREAPPGGALADIEYLAAPGLTTLRFFFSGAAPRVTADNSLPHALVLRLEGVRAGGLAPGALTALGLVDSARVDSQADGDRLLLHLDEEVFLFQLARLQEPAGFEVTLYAPAAGVDAEVVLARAGSAPERGLPPASSGGAGAATAGGAAGPATAAGARSAERSETATPLPGGGEERRPRAGIRTVVLDAGHGGRDVGAVGPGGLREKDVTLRLALLLKQELESRSDLRVILTRDRDVFVPLGARTRMANESGADLFLSIHCNSARSRSGQGFETYFLSEAKTEDERRVAQMENASLRFENPEIDPERLGELNFILWDLAQNEYLRESSSLAELVQGGLDDELDLRDRGVKQAGFWVLNGAFMPAVLVETAFISNPREERLLGSDDFRRRVVDGIADSVLEYVDQYERKVALRDVGA
jgi:N-acetylmuramoyl-L-alanine amidase